MRLTSLETPPFFHLYVNEYIFDSYPMCVHEELFARAISFSSGATDMLSVSPPF